MPEIVEVCLTAIYLNYVLKNKELTDINVLSGRYTKKNIVGLSTIKAKLPLKIKKVNSKGKFMWFELEDDFIIMNTFGLTASWGFKERTNSRVAFKIKDTVKNTNKNLYFIDPRNFGTLEITSHREKLDSKLDSLSPDFLKTSFTEDEFYQRVKDYVERKANRKDDKIVEVLMEQQKPSLGSGIGNYLAVEILLHAKISPHTKMLSLYNNRSLSDKLSKSIKYIIKLVYLTAEVGYLEHLDPNIEKFVKKLRAKIKDKPDHKYNFHKNTDIPKDSKFKFLVYRKKTYKDHPVKADIIIPKRTTYWVPALQVL